MRGDAMRFVLGYYYREEEADASEMWDQMVNLWGDSTDESMRELVDSFGFPYGIDGENLSFESDDEFPWGTTDFLEVIEHADGYAFIAHNPRHGYFSFYWSETNPFE
jgi:hypothetical protein